MGRIKKYFTLLLLTSPLLTFSQDKNEELIDWSTTNRLGWSDYKGSPDPNSGAAATTTSYLGIEYNFKNNTVTYKIVCRFSKNKSWGLYKTDHILSHEQGHFDITEIFARRLVKAVREYKFDPKKYQDDLSKMYKKIMEEKEEFQEKYDEETDFSRNKVKQAEWLKKIIQELEDLEEYGDYS